MKNPFASTRFPFALACSATILSLVCGCASKPAPAYLAAAEAQQRAQAEAASQQPTNFDTAATYLKVIGQMQKNDMWFASLAHIDALEQRWGASPDSILLRADALRNSGQPEQSAAFYQRLKGTALESSGLHGLGLLAGARSDFPLAVQLLEQARRLKPADPVLLGDLGYAHLRSGKAADARVPLMQAFELKPDSRQAQVNLALYFEVAGDSTRANSLMDSQQIPDDTRAAIRRAARELNSSLPPYLTPVATLAKAGNAAAPAPALSKTLAAEEFQSAALSLKASLWPDISRLQAADSTTPVAAAPTEPLAPVSITALQSTEPSATGKLP